MNTKHRFSPSEANSEFKSYVLHENKTILIGVPQIDEGDVNDISLVLDDRKGDVFCNKRAERIASMERLYSRLLDMSFESRNAIAEYIDRLKEKGAIKPHIGHNFWAVLNFLTVRYQASVSELIFTDPLIESIFVNDYYRSIDEEGAKISAIADIGKLRETAKPREENQLKINQFCASFLISPSVLYAGEGYFYTVSMPENISKEQASRFYNNLMKQIAAEIQKDDAGRNVDLKQLILQEGIVSEDSIEEWTLKTYFKFWYVPSKEVTKINAMLNTNE